VEQVFHDKAKDSGNRLRAYILSIASGGAGVLFFSLTDDSRLGYCLSEKVALLLGFVGFVVTVILCLFELHIDARRFFEIAKQHERPEAERNWQRNKRFKRLRKRLIFASYGTLGFAALSMLFYLISRLW
jgi:uncharacterized protein involved in cysteine biosynthesis